jgi:hypothetical protein
MPHTMVGKRTASGAKYRNPKDTSQTWTGRGRKPNWLVEALGQGAKLESFEVFTSPTVAMSPTSQHRAVALRVRVCLHSLDEATRLGFRAMQFNFVVATNERALRLWKSLGFNVVGQLPSAFAHPRLGYVDAFVLFRELAD